MVVLNFKVKHFLFLSCNMRSLISDGLLVAICIDNDSGGLLFGAP